MLGFSSLAANFRVALAPGSPFPGQAGGVRLLAHHQLSPRQVQIRQADQREHLRGVLGKPLVAHLRVAELALDYPENMLHPGTGRRAPAIGALVRTCERALGARLLKDTPQ